MMYQSQEVDQEVEVEDETEELSTENQANGTKKKKKKKKKKNTCPLKIEKVVDLKEFGALLNDNAMIDVQDNRIVYQKENKEYWMNELDVRVDEQVFTYRDANLERSVTSYIYIAPGERIPVWNDTNTRIYVHPWGTIALALFLLDPDPDRPFSELCTYDLKRKQVCDSLSLRFTSKIEFLKWITPDHAALVSGTDVYHMKHEGPLILSGRHEMSCAKIFNRDLSNHGVPIRDYLVSDSNLKDWVLLIPRVKCDEGKNGSMQLFQIDTQESISIPGYCACFTPCRKGKFLVVHTVLCYVAFEKDSTSALHMLELDLGLAVIEDNKAVRVPLTNDCGFSGPYPKNHTVQIHGSEKYGIVFLLTSLGQFLCFELNKGYLLMYEDIRTMRPDLGIKSFTFVGGHVFTFLRGHFAWRLNESILCMTEDGVFVRIVLNEDSIISYLLEVVCDLELVLNCVQRLNKLNQEIFQKQLDYQKMQCTFVDRNANQIGLLELDIKELEESTVQLKEHWSPSQFMNNEQEILDAVERELKLLCARNERYLDEKMRLQNQLGCNGIWLDRLRRHKGLLEKCIENWTKDPENEFLTNDLYAHLQYTVDQLNDDSLHACQQELKREEKKLRKATLLQEQRLKCQKSKLESVIQERSSLSVETCQDSCVVKSIPSASEGSYGASCQRFSSDGPDRSSSTHHSELCTDTFIPLDAVSCRSGKMTYAQAVSKSGISESHNSTCEEPSSSQNSLLSFEQLTAHSSVAQLGECSISAATPLNDGSSLSSAMASVNVEPMITCCEASASSVIERTSDQWHLSQDSVTSPDQSCTGTFSAHKCEASIHSDSTLDNIPSQLSDTGVVTVKTAVSSESAATLDSSGSADDIPEGGLCIVCCERPYNTVFLPCRHMWLCERCAKAVFHGEKVCPACRAEVREMMPVFIPD